MCSKNTFITDIFCARKNFSSVLSGLGFGGVLGCVFFYFLLCGRKIKHKMSLRSRNGDLIGWANLIVPEQ